MSVMNANDFFYRLMEIQPLYMAEDQFFMPFFDFQTRFHALQRHWKLNCDYINEHLDLLEQVDGDKVCAEFEEERLSKESAEFHHMLDDAIEPFEFMTEYLRSSTISFSLALVENLLLSLSTELSQETGMEIELDSRKLPYIDKYILWITRSCGLSIKFDKSLRKQISAMRDIRNRFLHQIDRDLQDQTIADITNMTDESTGDEDPVTNEVVNASLETVAEMVKIIELAYFEFHDANNPQET